MEQIIKKIFEECNYVERTEGISYFSKDDSSFFFLVSIPEQDFIPLKKKELIKENEPYKSIMDGFKAIINDGQNNVIEKNSSLIVLVKCSDINAITNLQQQILLFEEDEYFFKKYVILYTDSAITRLTQTPLITELRNKISDTEKFDRFSVIGFNSEIEEYLVVLQLFIKLPFLNLVHGTEEYTTLTQKINAVLDSDTVLYSTLLQKSDEITSIDFMTSDNESSINELLSFLPND